MLGEVHEAMTNVDEGDEHPSDGETTLWEAKAGEGPLRCEGEA